MTRYTNANKGRNYEMDSNSPNGNSSQNTERNMRNRRTMNKSVAVNKEHSDGIFIEKFTKKIEEIFTFSHLGLSRISKMGLQHFNIVKKIDIFGKYIISSCLEYLKSINCDEAFIREISTIQFIVRASRVGKTISPMLTHSKLANK